MRQRADEWRNGLTTALTWLRLALVAWATIVVLVDRAGTTSVRLGLAVTLLAAMGVWSALDGFLLTRRVTPRLLWLGDVALAMAVIAADHLVYPGPHPQSFGSAWPMSSAVVVGVWWGPRWGGAAGAAIGAAGAAGTAAFAPGGLRGELTSATATIVLVILAGVIAGVLADLLGRAELRVARADAREEIARHLHDGVLQTLAAVQRRSDDPALVALARDQELDLRRFITSAPGDGPTRTGLVDAIRDELVHAERRTSIRGELSVVDAVEETDPEIVDAVVGALGEAINNAHKHGAATRVVVYLDLVDDVIVCSIKDDGLGFDPAGTPEGTGLRRSIRGRIDDVDGRVEVRSRPGHGCEVLIEVPLR